MTTYCKIIAIAKNEGAYIPQWIAHHLYFGFRELEIWVNGTTDNSLELLEKISKSYPNIKFKNADALLERCLTRGENFQVTAYKEMLESTKQTDECTHIICLDLDELWTPKDFKTDINSAIRNNNSDAISFQWHLDTPSARRTKFARPFDLVNTYQKNRHVKTIAKLSSKPIKINIHNYSIDDGVYSLCDGNTFDSLDPDQHSRSKVSNDYFSETKTEVDTYFILHQMYRSCEEYIASLSRGRSHAGDGRAIKINRDGYILEPLSQHGLAHDIPNELISDYNDFYARFVTLTGIQDMIIDARKFNEDKFQDITDKIRLSKDFYLEFINQFKGAKLNDKLEQKINYQKITSSIDVINHLPDGSEISITGWAYDSLSDVFPAIKTGLKLTTQTVSQINRPDVQRVHKDAPLNCGFRLTLTTTDLAKQNLLNADPDLTFKSSHFSYESELTKA
jgi:hypothetical protein